jgi:two-component sensor histidine kinase
MREVNHRVGNSLQMIASMLTLHANAAGNPEVSEALTDATGRVLAVAQVHRRLYTSDDVQSVAVDQYLEALVEDLRRSSETNELAQLTLTSEPVAVDPDRAVAVGVIVNELVMNALKYAYPESKGPIRVDIREIGDNRAALIVEDDGVGIVPRAKPKSTGLGQRIVRAMGEKLNAEIEVDRAHKGTRVVVSFDLRKSPPPAAAATRPAA